MNATQPVVRIVLAALALTACAGSQPAAPAASQAVAAQGDGAALRRAEFVNPGGMWLPTQMTLPQHSQVFAALGVEIPAARLSDPLQAPLGAIASLGGCTASFVSGEGLLVTNHHCVQDALQYNATPEANTVETGVLAKTRADEKSAGPAARVQVTQSITDVTDAMRAGLAEIADPAARAKEAERRSKGLVADCEAKHPGSRCRVAEFFSGLQFLLIESLELRDVRLVYVPQRSIGNYGGEIDNWAWPRHTGDFAFYRAYTGPDGAPADFAPGNVPYKPKHVLKVSTAPLAPNDFVMVVGYPGRTSRTLTVKEFEFNLRWAYPYRIEHYKERYALLAELEKVGGATAIKATVMQQGVQNGLENSEGVLKGLLATDALSSKRALEAKVLAWANAPGKEAKAMALAKLDAIIDRDQQNAQRDFDTRALLGASKLLGSAMAIARLAEERLKPNAERRAGLQERDMPRMLARQKQFAKGYDQKIDRAMFKLALRRVSKLPAAARPWLPALLGLKPNAVVDAASAEAQIDKALDAFYAGTKLEDDAVRLDLLQNATPASLAKSQDVAVKLARLLLPVSRALEDAEDIEDGERLLTAPVYAEGLRHALDGFLAPDANSTLRITYGTIKNVQNPPLPRPFTVGAELLAKDTGKDPFDAPPALLAALRDKRFGPYRDAMLADLPVNFLADLDITGGNSGSPTLNHRGELIGLAFDGTIEGVASDVVFNPPLNRSIHVDSRYMAWVMDAVDQADNVLVEMGITPSL